jgi:hypothetical protein
VKYDIHRMKKKQMISFRMRIGKTQIFEKPTGKPFFLPNYVVEEISQKILKIM